MSHSLSSALTQALCFVGILTICIGVCFHVVMWHVMAAQCGDAASQPDEMKYIAIMIWR